MSAVLSVVQGATATAAHRLWPDGSFETIASVAHRPIVPLPGRVEHDPEELLSAVRQSIEKAGPVAAVGVANPGETCLAWDGATGRPLCNAIAGQDARTTDVVKRLEANGAGTLTRERAGVPLDPSLPAAKLRWLFDNAPDALDLMRRGRLRLGTSDAFLLDRLTGRFATDVTTAAGTGLMNLDTLAWDPDLCALFGVPVAALPQIVATTGGLGHMKTATGVLAVAASCAAPQAALYGQGCRETGDARLTLGADAVALALSGSRPLRDASNTLQRTVAWKLGASPATHAVVASVCDAGAAAEWARSLGLFDAYDNLRFDRPTAIERGLAFVPGGRRDAGSWIGLGPDTTRGDLVQALLEGIALQVAELLDVLAALVPLAGTVAVEGPLTNNPWFCRLLADASGRVIAICPGENLTGFGTALLARHGAGLGSGLAPAQPVQRFTPEQGFDVTLRARFRDAVERVRGWRR